VRAEKAWETRWHWGREERGRWVRMRVRSSGGRVSILLGELEMRMAKLGMGAGLGIGMDGIGGVEGVLLKGKYGADG